jgi:large repetitive protein
VALNSSELYDPSTGVWTLIGSMNGLRQHHTICALPSGKVLVAGGDSGGPLLASTELYDPVKGSWASTASLYFARAEDPIAILLKNGNVLIVGGKDSTGPLHSTELFH